MNSKVLMIVALLFAGSVSAIDNTENIPSLTGKTWFGKEPIFTFNAPQDSKRNLFGALSCANEATSPIATSPVATSPVATSPVATSPVAAPTRFARFKQVVANNPYKTGVAVVATVAVIAAVVAYVKSANEITVEESEEICF